MTLVLIICGFAYLLPIVPGCFDLSGGGLIRSYGGWEKIGRSSSDHTVRFGDERILGSSEFVESILKYDELDVSEETKYQRGGFDLRCPPPFWSCCYSFQELIARDQTMVYSLYIITGI